MNYGKFFRLNNEKSDIGKGIIVFDYLWLCDNESNNGLSEFPVYVTISKDSIDFHAHYYDEKKPEKHLHNTILSLPLSANLEVKDGLTGALVEGFKTNFPRFNNEKESASNYLWKLHWKTFWENKDWNNSDVSYSTLNIFDTKWTELIDEIEQWYENHKTENNVEDNFISYCETNKQQIKRFIRKLILDFMFDLEQTKVFQISPHYEHISVKLKENYFFSALAAKANFYYWREKIKKDNNKNNSVYVEYYLKAEMQWEKAIRSPKAEENFNSYGNNWFDDPEIEMKKVYDKNMNNIKTTDEILKATKKRNEKFSQRWRIAHYDVCVCLYMLMFRILISIAAAWFTFIIGSNLWGNLASDSFIKINPIGYRFWLFFIMLCLASFGWLICLRAKPKINLARCNPIKWKMWRIIFGGAAYMTLLSFIYSAAIGAFLRIFVFEKECVNYNYDIHYSCYYWFGEKSHFYWVGVCLAVFIGIVIYSIMNNKSPAEEL